MVAPATVDNAYGMVMTALADDDPVIVFEHVALANSSADVTTLRATDIARAAIRRSGTDVALITYGESLPKTLGAAERRALAGVDCEFDASVARVCSAEVPVPYAKHLEQAALRQTAQIVTAATEPCGGPA
ncbi:hypothetical protein MDOR_06950 [Mycolicibacterium doricum]|uniref:Uncharacterized protein n=1 Tax=Mycolicibacterium doricum TaxID=126673 RepID=A0A7I7VML1_9MYCO|nr:hypothetical protein MDOR_06950 [Mycolicibacterium doricum]